MRRQRGAFRTSKAQPVDAWGGRRARHMNLPDCSPPAATLPARWRTQYGSGLAAADRLRVCRGHSGGRRNIASRSPSACVDPWQSMRAVDVCVFVRRARERAWSRAGESERHERASSACLSCGGRSRRGAGGVSSKREHCSFEIRQIARPHCGSDIEKIVSERNRISLFYHLSAVKYWLY